MSDVNRAPAATANNRLPPAGGKVVAAADYRKAATTAGDHHSVLDLPILTDIVVEAEPPRLARA